MDEARQTVNKMLVEAEQNRALLEALRGNELNHYSNLVDDEFFHISCHVDQVLRQKIEAGQFVELEKLLTRDHPSNRTSEGRLGLFTKDGLTYFAPASDRDTQIGNVKRWEQAFRIYAAIYSKANPSCASEIWQYVHIINSASSTYQWSNVAEYDLTFRQLMATYPGHS